MSFLFERLICTRLYCFMVFEVRDRLGFLRQVRSASSANDCGDAGESFPAAGDSLLPDHPRNSRFPPAFAERVGLNSHHATLMVVHVLS
jgi:hypothetical protein